MGEVNPPRYSVTMSKDDPERERRLAEALRANLRRRKAQAREADAAGEQAAAERSAES
ncbi:hypothetical protein [Sphingomonas jatrophae]|uniref:hypothetical protein n=1 Tax=Sphingomonas jatrophae TaxID=1166337 RepID=UPI0013F4D53B|nr:hypothetical protein [Sphingomonas jatrophae]